MFMKNGKIFWNMLLKCRCEGLCNWRVLSSMSENPLFPMSVELCVNGDLRVTVRLFLFMSHVRSMKTDPASNCLHFPAYLIISAGQKFLH